MSEDSDGHIVTKLALKNGETYVLDLVGAQFGHFDPVMPWQDYVECRASEIEKTVSFGHSRLKQNRLCEMPGWEGVMFSANAFATSQMEQALHKWVSENLSLEAMLKLPEDSFKQKRAELLEVLKATLQDYKTSLTLEDVQTARLKVMEEGRLFYSL